jgi:hypothetical protein
MSEAHAIPPGRAEPSGIGGWLILPILGLFVAPLRMLTLMRDYDGISDALPLLGTAQAAFVVVEIGINLLLLGVAPIVLLVLLFKQLKLFPKMYIVWAIAGVVFQIVDVTAAGVLFQDVFGENGVALLDPETVREILRSLFTAVIWAPYMAASRRVRNTFVN